MRAITGCIKVHAEGIVAPVKTLSEKKGKCSVSFHIYIGTRVRAAARIFAIRDDIYESVDVLRHYRFPPVVCHHTKEKFFSLKTFFLGGFL